MRLEQTRLPGVFLIRGTEHVDDRGCLRKVLSLDDIHAQGLPVKIDQVLTADNPETATVRGLHYQAPPFEESKTLWVTRGALFDVVVDVRPAESTYGSWIAFELRAGDNLAVHLPPGVAHGYQTLEPDTSVTYLIGGAFFPSRARTLRWDDPSLSIDWPLPVSRISESDQGAAPWPPP